MSPRTPTKRRRWLGLFILAALFAVYYSLRHETEHRQPAVAQKGNLDSQVERASAPLPPRSFAASSATSGLAATSDGRSAEAELDGRGKWEARLRHAEFTLREYVKATRYPPGSRPMREHPD